MMQPKDEVYACGNHSPLRLPSQLGRHFGISGRAPLRCNVAVSDDGTWLREHSRAIGPLARSSSLISETNAAALVSKHCQAGPFGQIARSLDFERGTRRTG